mgnify:CR=1 FL=1
MTYTVAMQSYLELQKSVLQKNYALVRSVLPEKIKIISVVKGNGYGLGLSEVVKILAPVTDWFCVEDAQELKVVRSISLKPCLVTGYVLAEDLDESIVLQSRFSLFSWDQIPVLENIAKKFNRALQIHIKCDLLFGRLGFLEDDISHLCDVLKNMREFRVEGVYGHYISSLSRFDSLTNLQEEMFAKTCDTFRQKGFGDIVPHLAASGGILHRFKRLDQDLFIRPGALLYGIWPSTKNLPQHNALKGLSLCFSWKSRLIHVKKVPERYLVGYDATFTTSRPSVLGVFPLGYSDGVDRGLSNKGFVLVRGQRCPIIGNVSMNVTTVDVTDALGVSVGDEVVLMGKQGEASIHPCDLAEKADTTSYELCARISPSLARIVV